MAFLDEKGLEHLWDKISDKFSITKLWENAEPESEWTLSTIRGVQYMNFDAMILQTYNPVGFIFCIKKDDEILSRLGVCVPVDINDSNFFGIRFGRVEIKPRWSSSIGNIVYSKTTRGLSFYFENKFVSGSTEITNIMYNLSIPDIYQIAVPHFVWGLKSLKE